MKFCKECSHSSFLPPSYAGNNAENYRAYLEYWLCDAGSMKLACTTHRLDRPGFCGPQGKYFQPRET